MASSKKTNYYEKLKKADIETELRQLGLFKDDLLDQNKPVLEERLKEHMHGMHRVPAFIFNEPTTPLKELNLEHYECLAVEPLHAVKGHIINLYDEIPHHLDSEEKKEFELLKKASFNGKEVKNGSDYRESIVNMCLALKSTFPFYDLLTTFCEIQETLYQNESKRTVQSILRFHNITFKHFLLMHRQFDSPKSLTARKLFGQYYHAVVIHAPLQYRIINGISSNTEKEERLFNVLKTVTKLTSNHHPDHVLYNSLVRLQVRRAEKEVRNQGKNRISKSSSYLNAKTDSFFMHSDIKAYPLFFQSHLERISDYLLYGNIFWEETLAGIRFFDISEVQCTKMKHNFRSSTIKGEVEYLKKCWSECLKSLNEIIPAFKIVLEENTSEGKTITTTVKPTTLQKFRSSNSKNTHQHEVENVSQNKIITDTSASLSSTPSTSAFDGNQTLPDFSTPLFPKYKRKKNEINVPSNVSPIEKTKKSKKALKCSLNSVTTEPTTSKICIEIPKSTNQPCSSTNTQHNTNSFQNKTTKLLETVFGKTPILIEFDRTKSLFKQNPKGYISTLKEVSARLEVVIKAKCSSLNKEKKEYEDRTIKENNYEFKEIKDQSYINIINKLKILNAILKDL